MSGADWLAPPAGRFDVFDPDGPLRFATEADLRDGIAAVAWAAGWDVATEVPVANGGRADLVLSYDGAAVVVLEIKKSITTVGEARRAFQQADGYRRFFGPATVYLTAGTLDSDKVRHINEAYPDVRLAGAGYVMHYLPSSLAGDWTWPERAAVAYRRMHNLRRTTEVAARSTDVIAAGLRGAHLMRLARNYPAAANFLERELAA